MKFSTKYKQSIHQFLAHLKKTDKTVSKDYLAINFNITMKSDMQ